MSDKEGSSQHKLPQFLVPEEDNSSLHGHETGGPDSDHDFELACKRCGFLLTTRQGARQWWVETSRGNLCSRCFLVLWGTEGGSDDFEIGYIHGLDPIDPEPVLHLWDLVARMMEAWKSGVDVSRKMDALCKEGEHVLKDTVVGQVPALQLMEQIQSRRAQRYKLVKLRPHDSSR